MYYILEDGKWTQFAAKYRHACCDCGLIHDVEMQKRDGRFQMKWTRNKRATSARRRRRDDSKRPD